MRHALLVAALLGIVLQSSAADEDEAKKKRRAALGKVSAERILQRLDKNKDGKLSKDEVPERMVQAFDRIDANKDGSLDLKEIEQMLQRARQRNPNANPKGNNELIQRIMRLDANKDGKISKDEAKGPIEKVFPRADANNDGFLDKAELTRLAQRFAARQTDRPGRPGAGTRQPQGFPFFDSMDANADGRLTKEEVKSQAKVLEAFAAIDTGKDGKLDPKEYEAFLARQKKE